MEKFVFDACALIAYFNAEEGGILVKEKLELASSKTIEIYIHKVTLLELFYDCLKRGGSVNVENILARLNKMPIVKVKTIDDDYIRKAAYFKANYRISFADSFVLALGNIYNAKIITSDHHEFDKIEQAGESKFEWFR
ncbi:PIN domain-containing protein [Parasediminibacterium sp. JCM 36343]|uniref:PIN domain-containing protein n=1 Tax=Parasediminibacterium sp. JCM 36343 TaxID=3374279 RepID=UPI00397913BB